MSEVYCPYCNAKVEINHDDGYGYDEDEIHQQECHSCNNTFVYRTFIIMNYYTEKAECLNGGEHKFYKTKTFPPQFAVMKCEICGDTKPIGD